MAVGWMRLDHNFWDDDKFLAVLDECGEAGAWRVLVLYNLASQKFGRLDMTDRNVRRWVEKNVGMKGKRLDDFVEKAVGCGAFSREMHELGVLTSERLDKEGERARKTREARAAAGEKSGEARRRSSERED